MKLLSMAIILTFTTSTFSQSQGGSVGGCVAGSQGGCVGGSQGGCVGGSQGGGSPGGSVGGWTDLSLANCKKEDDGTKISCPDGIYIKSLSTDDSKRSGNSKEPSLMKTIKNELEKSSVSEQ